MCPFPFLISFISTFSSLLVAFRDTVISLCTRCPGREPTVHAKCTLKAMPIWKQAVGETTKGCVSVSEGSQSRLALPSVPPPPLPAPPSNSLLPPAPPCPLHAHPYFAHYMQTSPKPSQHSAKCLFINFHSPLCRKVIATAILFLCISICLSVSAISISMHTSMQTHFFLSFLSFFF